MGIGSVPLLYINQIPLYLVINVGLALVCRAPVFYFVTAIDDQDLCGPWFLNKRHLGRSNGWHSGDLSGRGHIFNEKTFQLLINRRHRCGRKAAGNDTMYAGCQQAELLRLPCAL